MDHDDFDYLQTRLCDAALSVIRYPDILEDEAYRAMTNEPGVYVHWWDGAFPRSDEDEAAIGSAARAFAHGKSLPELSLAQRGRFALRLRLASRILRAYSNRNTNRPAEGWFPAKLYSLPESELIEWLLLEATEFLLEVFDESLAWADSIGSLDTVDDLLRFPPGS